MLLVKLNMIWRVIAERTLVNADQLGPNTRSVEPAFICPLNCKEVELALLLFLMWSPLREPPPFLHSSRNKDFCFLVSGSPKASI